MEQRIKSVNSPTLLFILPFTSSISQCLAFFEWDQLVAEIATLKKKVQKQKNARMCMEGMFTYVEDQLALITDLIFQIRSQLTAY